MATPRRPFANRYRPEPVKTVRKKLADGNTRSAEIILADPTRYGGEGSLAVMWARAWAAKQGPADGGFRLTAPGEDEA